MSHSAHSDRGEEAPGVDPLESAGPASTIPEAELPPGEAGWSAQRVTLTAIAALVVIWLVVKAADDPRKFAVVTLNGLTLAALFFVVASGFTLIFGLMRVVNMAHGSLYLLGGYLALEMQESWFKEDAGLGLSLSGNDESSYSLLAWIVPLLLATALIGVLGVVIQQVFLRWNQGQDLRQALITIALSVIFADQMLAAFGGISKDIKTPTRLADERQPAGRRPLRLLPRRDRARRRAADRRGVVPADQEDALRQDRPCRRRRPRHGLRARDQRAAGVRRARS